LVRAFRANGLGAIATSLSFRGNRDVLATNKRLHLWGAAKTLTRILAAIVALVGAFAAIDAPGGRQPRPAPMVIRHTISSPEFGVQVTLPSTWSVKPGQAGTDFVATDSDTGAGLVGAVSVTHPSDSLGVDLDRIVEDQRRRFGTEQSNSRGVISLGPLDAQWAELAYEGQGNPTRIRTIALRRGTTILTLTCNGGDRAQTACVTAIRPDGGGQ
jgi:hypothetical protein